MPYNVCPSCGLSWNSHDDPADVTLKMVGGGGGLVSDALGFSLLADAFRFSRDAFDASRYLSQTCPSCLEAQQHEQEEYAGRLRQLMQAWEELDAAAEGMTVSEASGQIQKSPQQFLVARALFFELGSAKHVQSALSKAKGMVQHGKHFEVAGRRGDEAIWCLVNVFDVDRLVD